MMDRLQQSLLRLRSFFRWAQDDREFDAEMASHLAFATEENLSRGLPPSCLAPARLAAAVDPAVVLRYE